MDRLNSWLSKGWTFFNKFPTNTTVLKQTPNKAQNFLSQKRGRIVSIAFNKSIFRLAKEKL